MKANNKTILILGLALFILVFASYFYSRKSLDEKVSSVDTTNLKSFPVVVMDDSNTTNEGSTITLDYYRIRAECLREIIKPDCEIPYLQNNSVLEKVDKSGSDERRWLINGMPVTFEEYENARNLYLENYTGNFGYFAGNISVENGELVSFDWIQGTPFETKINAK